MADWKRNLIVCCFGTFVTGVALSQLAPVMPLYIQHLGVGGEASLARFSGLAFGVTFLAAAIFSPVWGRLSDKYGRKPMLMRASLGLAVTIGLMGFVQNVYQFMALRLLMGILAGYNPACVTLIAMQTDKEHAGFALGTLSASGIAGSLLGPIIGSLITENFGFIAMFLTTAGINMIAFGTTALFIRESFTRTDKKISSSKGAWRALPEKNLTLLLFATFFMLNFGMFSIEPIITVYVGQLAVDLSHIALISGLVFSASGLANLFSAPLLGRLSDRKGAHRVVPVALIFSAAAIIPQAFVTSAWQLMALRFLLGLAMGGLTPSLNALIKRITPDAYTGWIFGFSMGAGMLGVFGGSVLGGEVAARFGIEFVFFITSGLLMLNAVLVYFKVCRKLEAKIAVCAKTQGP